MKRKIRKAHKMFSTEDTPWVIKDNIVKHLTTLTAYIDLWSKNGNLVEHHEAALSKFEVGLALLNAVDPNNPMNAYFLQKKAERNKEKKKRKIGEIVRWTIVAVVTLTLLILIAEGVIG